MQESVNVNASSRVRDPGLIQIRVLEDVRAQVHASVLHEHDSVYDDV